MNTDWPTGEALQAAALTYELVQQAVLEGLTDLPITGNKEIGRAHV